MSSNTLYSQILAKVGQLEADLEAKTAEVNALKKENEAIRKFLYEVHCKYEDLNEISDNMLHIVQPKKVKFFRGQAKSVSNNPLTINTNNNKVSK